MRPSLQTQEGAPTVDLLTAEGVGINRDHSTPRYHSSGVRRDTNSDQRVITP
jgi:hypothetical protein